MASPTRWLSRSEWGLQFLCRCSRRLVIRYLGAVRFRMVWENPELHPVWRQRSCLYCAWHEDILSWAYLGAYQEITVLISRSSDGEYVARIIEDLGYHSIRGSTHRGAIGAVRELIRSDRAARLAITPDGPRGPRHQFKAGAVYVASRAGLPLVPMGFAYDGAWRLSSWDRFVVPRPLSRVVCYAGAPIEVPSDADSKRLAIYQEIARDSLLQAAARAERLLITDASSVGYCAQGPGQHLPEPANSESFPHTADPGLRAGPMSCGGHPNRQSLIQRRLTSSSSPEIARADGWLHSADRARRC